MLKIEILPVLDDNYVFFLEDSESGVTAVVDPSVSKEVLEFIEARPSRLDFILNTHHHWDHTGGNLDIKKATGCKIVGHAKDASRIPGLDLGLNEGETFSLGQSAARVLSIDGHTLGHIAFWFDEEKTLFCGDTLFSVGCGRLFEGTPQQMFESLSKLKKLPDETLVYCAHEYTLDNIDFAQSLNSDDQDLANYKKKVEALRAKNKPSIPCQLGLQKRINPFLNVGELEVFKNRRELKDQF